MKFEINGSSGSCGVDAVDDLAHTDQIQTATEAYALIIRRIFVLSAADKDSVKEQASQLAAYLKGHLQPLPHTLLRDLAFTLIARRSLFEWRMAFTSSSAIELAKSLDRAKIQPILVIKESRLGFALSGQGSQWHAMGRELINILPSRPPCKKLSNV